MEDKRNICLIGMSGAGKSFHGRRVAERLGYEFVDVDEVIETKHGKKLQDILDAEGDGRFIEEETKVVLALGEADGRIISPGGSVVYSTEAIAFLKRIAMIVYLDVPFETINERTTLDGRGIVGGGDKTFEEIYYDRAPLYEQYADIVVQTFGKTEEEVLEEILKAISA